MNRKKFLLGSFFIGMAFNTCAFALGENSADVAKKVKEKTYLAVNESEMPTFMPGRTGVEDFEDHGFEEDAEVQRRKKNSKVNQEDVIVVTGGKMQELAKNATEKVDIVTAEEIEAMGARNLVEVLSQVPGITINEHPTPSVSMQGLKGDYVKVMVDGIEMGGDIGGSAPISIVPAADIERIEIIQGASSALYGSDAMAGVINIITKKNKDKSWWIETKNEIDINKHYYGSFYTGYVNKYFGITGVGSTEWMPGILSNELNGMGEYEKIRVSSKHHLFYGKLKLDFFTPIGDVSAHINANENLNEVNISPDMGTTFYIRGFETGLRANLITSDFSKLNAFIAYKFMDFFNDFVYTGYGTFERKNSHFREVEADFNFKYDFTHEHGFLTGANMKWEGLRGIDFKQSKQAIQLGAFAQYEWNYGGEDWLKIVPALRFDISPRLSKLEPEVIEALGKNYSKEDDKKVVYQFTPKLSFKYNPIDNIALRLSYGMGFKVASLKQKYWVFFHPPPNNFVLFGNPALKPETSHGINASMDYQINENLNFTVAGFFNYLNNMIFAEELEDARNQFRDPNGDIKNITSMRRYSNLDRVISTGANASLKYKSKWWQMQLSYNYIYMLNYVREEERFVKAGYYVPHQVRFNTKFIIPRSFTNLDLYLNWDSPQPIILGFGAQGMDMIHSSDTKMGRSPDKFIVNVKLSQKLWHDRFELYMGVRNYLNNFHLFEGSNRTDQTEYFGLVEGISPYFGFNFKWN